MWVGSAASVFSQRLFQSRIRFLGALVGFGFIGIGLRLFMLQIVEGDYFQGISDSNRTQVIFLRAPRGNFYDRTGSPLVTNRPSWALMYSFDPESGVTFEEAEKSLAPFMEGRSSEWRRELRRAFQTRRLVRLAEDLRSDLAFGLKEMGDLIPGARIQMEFRRGFPDGAIATHVVGFLGEINDRELKMKNWSDRKMGDVIGKMGLEMLYDSDLRGRDGGMVIEVDSTGRLSRVIRDIPSIPGDEVFLTIDKKIQQAAIKALSETVSKKGAIVVMEANTGAVLAWVSAPLFHPDRVVDALVDPELPMVDRVYKGFYPPGSVFKMVTVIAGFQSKAIDLREKVNCIGYLTLPDRQRKERRFGCWKRHGQVDFWKAVADSCDVYFYKLGEKIGPDAMAEVARQFGMGGPVQKIFPGESRGTIPSPAWKRRRGEGGWSLGDTFNMSIGQGYVTTTPLQMAVFFMALATKGFMYETHFIQKMVDEKGDIAIAASPKIFGTVSLPEATWRHVRDSLKMTVDQGTGYASHIPYLDVWGKTGTAQNPHGEDHAWFAAFAGYKGESPSIVLSVFVENGGGGGSVAAPISKKILTAAFPPPPPGETSPIKEPS